MGASPTSWEGSGRLAPPVRFLPSATRPRAPSRESSGLTPAGRSQGGQCFVMLDPVSLLYHRSQGSAVQAPQCGSGTSVAGLCPGPDTATRTLACGSRATRLVPGLPEVPVRGGFSAPLVLFGLRVAFPNPSPRHQRGPTGTRTRNLRPARAALNQLSYRPMEPGAVPSSRGLALHPAHDM
jgi:hypothetical protein